MMNDYTPSKIPILKTAPEIAKAFCVPVHFVREKARLGEIVAVRAGRKVLINQECFAEFLSTNKLQEAENSVIRPIRR